MNYFLVQPWGRRPREHTLLGEYPTVEAAFAALDAMAEKIAATGGQPDSVEIVVVDDHGKRVPRTVAH